MTKPGSKSGLSRCQAVKGLAAAVAALGDGSTQNIDGVNIQTDNTAINLTLPERTGAPVIAAANPVTLTILGDGNDTVTGSSTADFIVAGKGNDQLFGGGGNDFLVGGAGQDTIEGGSANDVIYAGTGKALVIGSAGSDVIDASKGSRPTIARRSESGHRSSRDSAGIGKRRWFPQHIRLERCA